MYLKQMDSRLNEAYSAAYTVTIILPFVSNIYSSKLH